MRINGRAFLSNTHFLRQHQQFARVMTVMTLLFFCLSAGGLNSVMADTTGNFSLEVVYDPDPGAIVQTGDLITYRVTFGCNSTVANCGAMNISTVFPAYMIPVDVQVTTAQGYTGVILLNTPTPGESTVTVGHPNLLAGRSSEALITVRISQDALPGPLPGVVFTGSIPAETEPPIAMGDLEIEEQNELWGVTKTKTNPVVDPASDSPVSYSVNLCPATAIDNVTLTNVVLTDTLPAGITAADILNMDGGTFVPGVPNNFITWTLPGPFSPANGCVSRNVVLSYPNALFNGTNVTNSADAVADHRLTNGDGICDADCPGNSVTHPIVDPDPDTDVGKSVSLGTISQNAVGRYFLTFNNPGSNVDVTDFVVRDNIPAGITVTRLESGTWLPAANALVEYSTNGGTIWLPLGGGTGITDGSAQLTQNFPPGVVTNVRWTFAVMPLNFAIGQQPEIVFTPTVTNPALQNCVVTTYDDYDPVYPTPGTSTDTVCATTNVITPSTQVVPSKARINGSGDLQPNQLVDYRLRIDLTERSSANINGLTIVDVLPDELMYVSHTITYTGGVTAPGGEPTFNNAPDTIAGTPYLQVLTWDWNTINVTPPPSGTVRRIDVVVTAQVRPGVPANPNPVPAYENQAFFLTDSPDLQCEAGTTLIDDLDDLDGDLDTAEDICFTDAQFRVVQAASLAGDKWIRDLAFQTDFNEFEAANPASPDFEKVDLASPDVCPDDDNTDEPPQAGNTEEALSFTRYPCVTFGYPENADDAYDDFEYKLIIINDGNVNLVNYILYDILPYVGDTGSGGPQSTVARNSEFQPFITGPVTLVSENSTDILPADVVIEYNTSNNPCRTEVGAVAGCDNATPWTGTFVGARSFRVRIINAKILASLETFTLNVPMRIPDDAQSGQISWNSFAQSGINALSTNRIATSEPLKVGIKVPQRMSVGNRVWLDNNDSGTINAGDDFDTVTAGLQPGIPNVLVNLYRDADNNNVPDGPAIAFDVTDATGHYLFANIVEDAVAANNRYIIGVDASNFAPAGALFNLVTSTGVNNADNIDSDDNGIDPATFTDQVLSAPFTLSLNMATGETDISLDTGMGTTTTTGPTVDDGIFSRGVRGESDRNSNLTIDFGFLPPYSIGNRVWLDNGGGVDELLRNNGVLDFGTELGIANVRVELFYDANDDGVFTGAEDTTPIRFDTTDPTGYYLFDRLPQGNYQVRIPASNFAPAAPLVNLFSSTTGGINPDFTPDNETDSNDNGVDNPNPPANGIRSVTISLGETGDEPINETDLSADTGSAAGNSPTADDGPQSRGRNGELDEHSDLTVDFGFYQPFLSIGNRVWYDTNNSGTLDAGDDLDLGTAGDQPGIPGVIVNLYLDATGDGIPDTAPGAPFASDTTDLNGYYLFDRLPVGRYVVAIDPANFVGAGALAETTNSTTTAGNGNAADGGGDTNDNGLDAVNPTYGVVSVSLNLVPFLEPIAETELSGSPLDDTTGFPGTYRGLVKKEDNESDLTVDFGFFKPMSIGNRVWHDNGGGTPANRDNGVQDAGELGMAGVRVELYRDTNGNGRPEAGEFVGFDTTDATGFYLFDRVTPGTYLVYIPPVNFLGAGVLANFDNSNPTGTETVGVTPPGLIDMDDNGIYENLPEINGVVSGPIIMERDNEPVGEADLSTDTGSGPGFDPTFDDGPLSRGRFNESDDNSNLTIDFGFVQPVFSLGNRVWADTNNNGLIDGTDDWPEVAGLAPGIPGVRVSLYADNGNGVFNLGVDTVVGTDVTDANGYYLFENLPAGNYFVWINQLNFRAISAGNPDDVLFDWYSSTPTILTDNQTDNDDNGIDDSTPDVGGIASPMITLSKNDEPIGELDLSGNPLDLAPNYRGNNGELDSNSDLTIDFGFYKPLSLGNRVWFDSDGDGTIDFGSETGIAGVRVELFGDTNSSGTFDAGDVMVGVDTTDATGYYLFDNLTPGTFFVHIPAGNFGVAAGVDNVPGDPLLGRTSTVDDVGGALDIDNNDNGNDDPTPLVNGITSDLITLSISAPASEQPINEGDLSTDTVGDGPNRRGRFGETDNNSDLTIDFGFVGSRMSLGNRVWYDGNNNALIDTTGNTDDYVTGGAVAPGIPGVTVRIYRDTNADGIPDTGLAVVPDEITDANGYYLFENLQPGTYVVGLLNSNFAGPLNGLISSTGNTADTQVDNDDNGVDAINPTFGLLSPAITLVLNGEPILGALPNNPPGQETDLSNNAADSAPGYNGTGITDNNGELTIDFGLYRPLSIGNRLWFDTDGDGTHDVGESGVPAGVTLTLYHDINADGDFDDPGENTYATTTTDANGYYLFDGLGTGRYVVVVDAANFNGVAPLVNYNSSTGADGTTTTDRTDNGIDPIGPATAATDGIRSNVVTLTLNTAPTTEADLSGNPIDGPESRGVNGETNPNSNLTIDFGFVTTTQLSLGNLVWLDNGAGGGTGRDGIRNGGELPLANVRVNLYRDVNADGIPDDLGAPGAAGDVIATDMTDVNGHYLFDNLAPGNYIVELAAANFNAGAVLDGYGSTTTLPADVNNQDNGIDTPNTITGIRSGTINLAVGAEPSTAGANPDDDTPAPLEGYGGGGIDANGNMTVDFGVYRPMSIGNRVWFDTTADGLISPTENGIAGVTVELRQDANNDGIFDPAIDIVVVGTDITDSLGYYLFGDLLPGNYFVYIPPSQFIAGAPLDGFASTLDNVGAVPNDNNDNGVVNGTGIVSNQVALVENAAPTNETDFSGDANADGPRFIGLDGENNRNSDISIDFGFTATPMSLGNRVWLDNNDNGLMDAGDDFDTVTAGDQPGIGGVRVNLYADTNADGLPDGAVIRSDTTDPTGYYLFDNLPPGNYLVQIAPNNFVAGGVLRGLFSSTGVTNDPLIDINDNGIDNTNPGTNGIFSATIVLTPGAMPVGETDLSGNAADGPIGESRGNNGETDINSNLTIDFGFSTRFDWGDAPDTYGTNNVAGDSTNTTDPIGPSHVIVGNLFMGTIVDDEGDGQPSVGADGDDTNGAGGDDEDGVTIPTVVAGTNLNVEVTVFNNTGSTATLVGWVDVDGNGVFDPGEGATVTVPSAATPQTAILTFPIPNTADIDTGGSTYARFRLSTDPLTTNDVGGPASDGEIEDYVVPVTPPGVSITKTDGINSIVTGQSTTYTITIQYSGLTGITRVVDDTTTPGAAFMPDSPTTPLAWTCTANAQASCITGQALGTGIAVPVSGLITAQSVDLQQGGELIFTQTGTLRPDYNDAFPGVPDVVNTVALDSGETATDTNGVIFDPPFGVKTGVALNSTTIRWTMIWFNTGLPQAATITDVLEPDQINPTNLVCTPFGTTSGPASIPPAICEIQGGNTMFWSGTMGDGTTPGNRSANRLQISFDVTVPGPGSYDNLATISTGPDSSTADTTVVIPRPGEENPEEAGAGIINPTIAKLVDPPFAQPGDTVTWTILVINPHNQAINNVTVYDTLPDVLSLLSSNTTNGTVTVNGQLVTLTIPTLNALETVTLTIRTRISPDSQENEILNLADLSMPNSGTVQTAEAVVLRVAELPATGEMPQGWIVLRGLVILLSMGGIIGVVAFKIARKPQLR